MTRISRRSAARLLLLALLVTAIAIIWLSPLRQHLNRDEVRAAVEHARGTWYGPLVLIAMYAIGCIFAIPASLFIVAAGAIWGWFLGGTYAMAGGILGAMASFFVGRFLGNGAPGGSSSGSSLRRQLGAANFRSLLVLRLLPLFPFAALNYAAGVVRVDAAAFFYSTLLGLVPSNYIFAWSADEIFNGAVTGRAVMSRLLIVAAIAVVAVTAPPLIARILRPHSLHR